MRCALVVLSALLTVSLGDSPGENLPLGGPAGYCPDEDGEKPIYLLDLKNKYAFYECANGEAYLQYCTAGLIFNPKKDICDYVPEDCEPFGPVGVCPVTNPKLPVFLRDALVEKIFYICENGMPRRLRCAGDLVFDPYKESCVS